MVRPSWDEYCLAIADAVALRADCKRRAVGAVLVDTDHLMIATGYNGTRSGVLGCLDGACPRGALDYSEVAEFTDYNDKNSPGYCISSHAEVNALLHSTRPVQGATMYVTCQPCEGCSKILFNSGLYGVVYRDGDNIVRRIY